MKSIKRSCLYIFLFASSIAVLCCGCSRISRILKGPGTTRKPPIDKTVQPDKMTRPTVKPPGGIDWMIRVENWDIRDDRILGYRPDWGNFRYVGPSCYMGYLVFKLKSDRFPDHYWMAIMPQRKTGTFEIRALRYEEPSSDIVPIRPPNKFTVWAVIKNSKIQNYDFMDPKMWGTFYKKRVEVPYMYLGNDLFKDSEWRGELPKIDGIHYIIFELIVQ